VVFQKKIPSTNVLTTSDAIYYVPDLDVKVQVWINASDTGQPLACVEADLSNGKTVHQKAVEWVLAVVIGLGLIISAITSGLGHDNAAAHLASNTMSLFGFFQAQALLGMAAVTTPPIVRAWTQNFQWSMGLIRIHFLQRMATWYQRATGGNPTTFLSSLATISVKVQKRELQERSNAQANTDNLQFRTVKGIERVGFVAKIEISNIFFTGYTFFVIFVLLTTLGVYAFKKICDVLVKKGKMKPEKFQDLRSGWMVMLKGILFRIVR
jgi:putative Mn2+ efflux pump MntP